MNQNINLYQPIFRRQRKIFSADTMLVMMAVLLAGLVLITLFGHWRQAQLDDRVAQLESQEEQALERLTSLEETLPPRRESPALQRAVAEAEREVELKRRALEVLDQGMLGQQTGFSTHLLALSRQRVEPVWLTGIHIDKGGAKLDLHGRTQRASQVPVYLQRLSDETVFAGTDFRRMRIQRTELENGGEVLEFHLSTEAETEDEESGS